MPLPFCRPRGAKQLPTRGEAGTKIRPSERIFVTDEGLQLYLFAEQ